MGYMTLGDFRDELNLSLGDRRQSSNEPLDRWINRAYFELTGIVVFDALVDVREVLTYSCNGVYNWPTGAIGMISAADVTNKRRLHKIDLRNYHRLDPEQCGDPTLWTRRGDSFIVWPAPEEPTVIQQNIMVEPDPLLLASDKTVVPSHWDQAVVLLSQKNAWLSLRDNETATLMYQAAQNFIRQANVDADLSEGTPSLGITTADSFEDLGDMRTEWP
jgi:hypothetical protein